MFSAHNVDEGRDLMRWAAWRQRGGVTGGPVAGALARLCSRCEAAQPEGGDSDHREGGVAPPPVTHPGSRLSLCRPCCCCCCCSRVISKPMRRCAARASVTRSSRSTRRLGIELPLDGCCFPSCSLCFPDCEQGTADIGMMCLLF